LSDNDEGKLVPSPNGGVFNEISIRLRLIWRLLLDRRVNPLLKLLPLGSLFYLFIPDVLPGPIDDAALISILSYIFVELCPKEVVQEHMDALTNVIDGEWREIDEQAGE
jgi:hypothetical protein